LPKLSLLSKLQNYSECKYNSIVDEKVDADSHQKTGSADSGIPCDVETSVVEGECIVTFLILQVL